MSDNRPTQTLPDYPHFYPQPDWAHEHGVSHERILETRSRKPTEKQNEK